MRKIGSMGMVFLPKIYFSVSITDIDNRYYV